MELYKVFIPSRIKCEYDIDGVSGYVMADSRKEAIEDLADHAESCELPRDQLAVSRARASGGFQPKDLDEACWFCTGNAGRLVFSG